MEAIKIVGVTNPHGNVAITITSIYQDEPTDGLGDGDTPVDGIIQGSTALVRRERSGNKNGRLYHIAFHAQDSEGSCTGTVTVCVPHDQRPGATCIDGGSLYDSTKATSHDSCRDDDHHGDHDDHDDDHRGDHDDGHKGGK
jgi:hypothetical protein